MAGLGSLDPDQRSLLRQVGLNDAFGALASIGGRPYQPRYQSVAMQMLQKAAADRAEQQRLANAQGILFGGQGVAPQQPQADAPAASPPQPFAARLAQMESGGRPDAVFNGPRGAYVGQYQIGADRLMDYNRATGENIPLMALKDQNVSKRVYDWHMNDIDSFIDSPEENLAAMEGQEVKGIKITRDGMRAAAHLGGKRGLWKFLATGGKYDPADANGTRMSDYMKKFEAEELPGPAWSAPAQKALQEARGINSRAFRAYAAYDPAGALELAAKQSFETPTAKVVGKSLVDPTTGQVIYTDPQSGGSFRPATPQEAASYGAQYGQFDEEGRFYETAKPGMNLEVGPDGRVVLSQGGQQGLGRAATNTEQKSLANSLDLFGRLDRIGELAGIDPVTGEMSEESARLLTYRGKAEDYLANIADKAGLSVSDVQKKAIQERAKFTTSVEQLFNAYRKEITGAAAAVQELDRLKKSFLNTDMGPTEFAAAYGEYQRELKRAMRLSRKLLREGFDLRDSSGGDAMDRAFLGGGDDSPGERFRELRSQGLSISEANRRLDQEGYPDE